MAVSTLVLCLGLLLGCASPPSTSHPSAESALRMDLQSGFDHSEVVVNVDGRVVLDRVLTSDAVLGYAASVQASPGESFTLEVKVSGPSQHLRQVMRLSDGGYLGIYLESGKKLKVVQQATPFLYD